MCKKGRPVIVATIFPNIVLSNRRVIYGHASRQFLSDIPYQSFSSTKRLHITFIGDRQYSLRQTLPPALDHRTTASEIKIYYSFGSLTVIERISPGRIGRSPESHHTVHERFPTVLCPWKGDQVISESALHGESVGTN